MSKIKPISECDIKIIGGQIMSRVTANTDKGDEVVQTIKVIIPKAVSSDGTININEVVEEPLRTEPDIKKVVKAGDIVMKLSTPYDAAIIDEDSEGALIPSFCAIVRTGEEIDKNYLLAFLNSSYCKDQLKLQVSGAVMTVLSVGKVGNVNIPVPSLEEQQRIGSSYIEVQNKLKLIKQIAELESKKNDIIFRDLVKANEDA